MSQREKLILKLYNEKRKRESNRGHTYVRMHHKRNLARTTYPLLNQKIRTCISRLDPDFHDPDFSTNLEITEKDLQKDLEKSAKRVTENQEQTTEKIQNLSRNGLLSMIENKVGSKLVEKVGSKLVENQLRIILLISEDGKITKNRMSKILNISEGKQGPGLET